jgi:hypothetical protein
MTVTGITGHVELVRSNRGRAEARDWEAFGAPFADDVVYRHLVERY